VHGATRIEPEEEEEEEEQQSDDDLKSRVDWGDEASNYDMDESLVELDAEAPNYEEDVWDLLNEEEAKGFEEEQSRNFKDDMKDESLMKAFKNRAPAESVRWRALPFRQGNEFLQNSLQVMMQHLDPYVSSLWKHLWRPTNLTANRGESRQALPTTLPRAACKTFLEGSRKKSMTGIKLWSKDPEILEHKEHFFSALPVSTEELFKDFINETSASRMEAVSKLIDLHNGEVVEVPTTNTKRWTLTYVHGISGLDDLPEQFQKGRNFMTPTLNGYDKNNIRMSIVQTLLEHKKHNLKIYRDDLQPNWQEQWNRVCVPCKGTKMFVWLRSGSVITLGELFAVLHHKYTCREIYLLYLHLEIVALKRKKDPPKHQAAGTKRKNNDTW
jgi:hypothetical protein